MSDRRTPFQIQIELNEVISKRIDLQDKWLSELTAVVKDMGKTIKLMSEKIIEMENK